MEESEMRNGHRLNVWLPENYRWMLDAIEELIEERESKGVLCSKSEITRELLATQLIAQKKKRDEQETDDHISEEG